MDSTEERPQHDLFFDAALALAREAAQVGEVPVGAVLVQNGRIVARGRNRREERCAVTGHAELEALADYAATFHSWRLAPGTDLYVTVEPCLMCTGALLWARVSAIYYGCPDPREAGLRTQAPLIAAGRFDHQFTKIEGGLREAEAAQLMKDFFRKKREEKKAVTTAVAGEP